MRVTPPVVIDSSQKGILEQWARSRSLPARQVERESRAARFGRQDRFGDCGRTSHR